MERRRVVVTGMGIICPVGNNREDAWRNAREGVSGIANIQRVNTSDLQVHFAGEVRNFDAKAIFGYREVRRMDRVTQLAMTAALEAVTDSGLNMENEERYDVGCLIGSGIGGIETTLEQANVARDKGPRSVSPLLIPMLLPDSPSGRVAMEYGMRGPNIGLSTACATGNNSIGEATEMIRRGAANVMLGGSTEAGVVPLAIASFDNMGVLSRRNDDPASASRPFDKDRDGFIISEGAAVLVLEELEHAKARGAKIYGEVLGYGNTDDAYHVTAPLENGEGAEMAMRKAIRNAELTPEDIDYINAHGTSTSLNDSSETKAIKTLLGEKAYDVPISATKSVTGHLLGGAGSVEAVFSIMSIVDQFIPPTMNYYTPDPECDLNYTPNKGVSHKITTVMSNSFGFGGHNAVLVFGKYSDNGK